MMPWLTVGGWAGTLMFFAMYLGIRDDLAAEVERCNTDKLAAVAAAERVARDAMAEAMGDALAERDRQLEAAERAREIAQEAARLAESRVPEVIEVIRESTDACITAAVPDNIVDRLRD